MGKTGRWLRSFLSSSGGKKDKVKIREKEKNANLSSPLPAETRSAPVSVSTPKEKRRWSFRRSMGAGKDLNSPDLPALTPIHGLSESDTDQKRHTMAVAESTAAAKDAAMAGAQAAATKIQAAFRSYLARKALFALRGLVKLQALVRGRLVRRQVTATLRCMQALVAVQARACAQQTQMLEESQSVSSSSRQTPVKRSPHHPRFRQSFDVDRCMEENVKIVEMDLGEARGCSRSRNSYSITQYDRTDHRYEAYGGSRAHPKIDPYQQFSPAPSALTDISPRGCSGRFEDFSFATAQSSPHYFSPTSTPDARKAQLIVSQQDGTYSASSDYPFFPSYMANTESSRAKSRSQSAPRQRPDSYEREPSRRRPSVEGRNIPRSVRMQRSSSHIGASVSGCQYPWQIKLDRSNMSLKDSECGSTSTVMSNANYCRSIASSVLGIH